MPIGKGKRYLRKLIKMADEEMIECYKKAQLSDYKASKPIDYVIKTLRPVYTMLAICYFERDLKRVFKPDFIDID
jgi:hypothetical protein